MSDIRLEVKGLEEIKNKLTKEAILQPFNEGIKKITLALQREVSVATPVDTGRLRASITPKLTQENGIFQGLVGTNVNYACVIGARHQVYEPIRHTSANIGNYPFENVLSKDGMPHLIEGKHKFIREHLDCVSIQTRKGRKPLFVTLDHLVLIWREGHVIWEQAQRLKDNDMVFGKRSHNAIVDNSNKEAYLCFCGTIFWVTKDILLSRQPKYCSRECQYKYGTHAQNTGMKWSLSEEQKRFGENNPQWRDGSALKPYDHNFNGKLKTIVRERDGWQCQECGNPFDLLIHHKDWDKLNSSIDNLITLCRSCHGKLNRQDCELPEVNQGLFVPKSILNITSFTFMRKGKARLPYLYDFTVREENSFMVGGILVHNSSVEYGTQPHIITPKTKKALHWQVGGKDIFAKVVHHPGSPGRHVVEGSSVRVKGEGMFAFGLKQVKEKLGAYLKEIGVAIEQRWNK